jgi:hypothetical protein
MSKALKRKKKRNTQSRSRLLENGINALRCLGFEHFENIHDFNKRVKKAGQTPLRYLIERYPYATVFGTPGRKEAFIYCDGVGSYIFEAKFQQGSGSVDEKIPCLWMSFEQCDKNWVIWFDGNWWRDHERGRAVVAWARNKERTNTTGRHFTILASDTEFVNWAKRTFGYPSPAEKHEEQESQPNLFGRVACTG